MNGWKRWLPGLQFLSRYEAAWLPSDLMAGLVLTTMLVPVGIAYAVASGVPGIYGLYATIVPLLAYAVFGPSRILVLGPDSALAPVILAVVLPLSGGDPARAVTIAAGMAIVSGLVCVLVGVMRLGFVTELLSKPIRYGYMNGIALTVLISQLPKLFGFSIDGEGPLRDLAQITASVLGGQANWTAFAVGGATLVCIMLLKRFDRIPGILIAVVGATIVVGVFGLERAGLKVLGALPQGLPSFALPWLNLADLRDVVIGGCAVAVVAFADTSVLSRTYAAKTRSHVDPNQEMIGLGAANLAAGLFQGFPISSSSSRTPVAEAAGAKTQLTGVVGAVSVALLLLLAPNLLQNLPTSALAAVVIAAAIGLFEFADLRRIFRIQRWEFWLSIVCFVGVAVLGVIPGIGLAIVLAVIEFLWDGWRPHYTVLGRVNGIRGYHDIKRYPEARRIPGLVLFRWDAPLFFANAELFHQCVLEAVAKSPTPVRRIIVAAEPVTSIDVTSADMLAELEKSLRESGIELRFAEMKDPVKDKLKRFELLELFGVANFYPTLGAAIDAYLDEHSVDWKPWKGTPAMDPTLLIAFGASFFLVSLSPGLCMTLAMSLGITIGVRRTLWMMAGELTGIALVGAFAVLGVAALLLKAPTVFAVFKWIGAAYLIYMGWQTWHADPMLPAQVQGDTRTRSSLILQGFITAVANPKAWAFFVALLPPFIDQNRPLVPQLMALLALMLVIEFTCMQIYAHGGRALREQLHRHGKARWLNRMAGSLMAGVGIWLALG